MSDLKDNPLPEKVNNFSIGMSNAFLLEILSGYIIWAEREIEGIQQNIATCKHIKQEIYEQSSDS